MVFLKLQKPGKKSLFFIPFLFTFANALCGFMSVVKTLDEDYVTAALFILLAAFMDLCDGRLARMFGSTSVLGMELDSLCDAISFCFAPAILLYSWSLYQLNSAGLLVLGIYLCSGLFRLARFNSTAQENVTWFIGLPTTIAAFLFSNVVIYEQWIMNSKLAWALKAERLAFLVTIVSLLMICSIKFPSSKQLKLKVATSGVLILCCMIGAWSVIQGQPAFLILTIAYIVMSFVFSLAKEITRSWWISH
jgi:CDP-diacylglycerol--serine O-phosphatidyltransferase